MISRPSINRDYLKHNYFLMRRIIEKSKHSWNNSRAFNVYSNIGSRSFRSVFGEDIEEFLYRRFREKSMSSNPKVNVLEVGPGRGFAAKELVNSFLNFRRETSSLESLLEKRDVYIRMYTSNNYRHDELRSMILSINEQINDYNQNHNVNPNRSSINVDAITLDKEEILPGIREYVFSHIYEGFADNLELNKKYDLIIDYDGAFSFTDGIRKEEYIRRFTERLEIGGRLFIALSRSSSVDELHNYDLYKKLLSNEYRVELAKRGIQVFVKLDMGFPSVICFRRIK